MQVMCNILLHNYLHLYNLSRKGFALLFQIKQVHSVNRKF